MSKDSTIVKSLKLACNAIESIQQELCIKENLNKDEKQFLKESPEALKTISNLINVFNKNVPPKKQLIDSMEDMLNFLVDHLETNDSHEIPIPREDVDDIVNLLYQNTKLLLSNNVVVLTNQEKEYLRNLLAKELDIVHTLIEQTK